MPEQGRARDQNGSIKRTGLVDACFISLSIASLTYALVTAPRSGIDLSVFQHMGQGFVAGIYQKFDGPPQSDAVLFAPLALLSFDSLVIVWLLINLGAAAITLYLTITLLGASWPPRAKIYLSAFLLSWAPLRVTLRNGQLSLLIVAALIGALLARKRDRKILAGVLLGLSLCKYSLTYPFVLYFAWKREWRVLAMAALVPALLLTVYALRLGISPVDVVTDYAQAIGGASLSEHSVFEGSTDLKPLIAETISGNGVAILAFTLCLLALLSMWLVFRRSLRCENAHFGLLALFALWSVYHRSYDSVLCILPAAFFIDLFMRRRFVRFSSSCLAGFCLFIIGIPGVLTDRLRISPETLSASFIGFLGLHVERLLVFGMFCASLVLLWRVETSNPSPLLGKRRRETISSR